jgi:serine O-acetyltransferase
LNLIEYEIISYKNINPAIYGFTDFIFNVFDQFFAVICYRFANFLWNCSGNINDKREFSYKLHRFARSVTAVDIHPAAQIGERIVLDHASGTVIGSTSRIGNDCYILNGVILGSKFIADNPKCIRHPNIDNNVQIDSFEIILGNIRIVNNVFIDPMCCVIKTVQDNVNLKAFLNLITYFTPLSLSYTEK